MALDFAEISTAGGFFKPGDHSHAVAILVEPTRLERQKPGQYGPKDTIHADLTVFSDAAAIDAGIAADVPGTQIQQTLLARDLEPLVGKATIVKLEQRPSNKPGQQPAWVWRQVDPEIRSKVVEWANRREAALEAAKSTGAMPSFLS